MAAVLVGLGLPAHAESPGLPAAKLEWVMIEPKPAFNPGFLAVPDDSDTGPVFRCASRACEASAPTCTARIHPENASLWNGIATPAWFADPRRFVLTAFLGIEDAERISLPLRERLDRGRSGLDRSSHPELSYDDGDLLGSIQKLGERDVILSRITYTIGEEKWSFQVVTWIEQDRLYQNTCTIPGGESFLEWAALDFTRDH